MELILISNSKLKIMLTAEDMKKYNIDCEGDVTLRRGFRPVLERARRDCGFDPCGGRLLVQVFPSRSGGCELFVTRVGQEDRASQTKKNESAVFLFDTLGDLIALCGALECRGYGEGSLALLLEGGACALVLPDICGGEPLPLDAAVLEEYGRRCEGECARIYIEEHSVRLCEGNAVRMLSRFC